MNKYLRLILDREFRFSVLAARGFYRNMSDEELYRHKYRSLTAPNLTWSTPKASAKR